MPAQVAAEMTGVQDTIKRLRQIDPELRKEFNKDARNIAQPIIIDARNQYGETFLSGMARPWVQNSKPKFPYDAAAAKKGVKFKIDTRRKSGTAIKIQQTDPAAAIIEVAGRKRDNKLGTNLDRFGQPSRFLWPAAERQLAEVTRLMVRLIEQTTDKISKGLK